MHHDEVEVGAREAHYCHMYPELVAPPLASILPIKGG